MAIVPMPVRPATVLRVLETTSYRRANFRSNGTIINWTTVTGSDLIKSVGARTHVTNKIRFLSSGTPWKPTSDFHVASLWCDRPAGTIRGIDPTTGRTVFLLEGSSNVDDVVTGPFMGYSNIDYFVRAIPSNTLARLNTELMLKVGDRKVNYGEALGEARTTVGHLAKSASSLARALLAARKGNWSAVARALDVTPRRFKRGQSAASRWLEYQYGWLPLMGDIYDSSKLLEEGFRQNKMIMSETRVLRDSDNRSSNSSDDYLDRVYGHSSVSYRAKVFFSIQDGPLAKLNQLGLINPAEVAWALVPFSFVFDWFVPVGNYMEALAARFGVDFIDGFYGTRVSGVYTKYLRLSSTTVNYVQHSVVTRSEIFGYRRTKMTGFPVPGLYYKSPFSSNHLTSAIALVRQLIR